MTIANKVLKKCLSKDTWSKNAKDFLYNCPKCGEYIDEGDTRNAKTDGYYFHFKCKKCGHKWKDY